MIYAIGYGRLGYPVMPGARFRNMPHKMLGKGWSHKATGPGSTDERQIIGWWLRDPVANIGLQAGRGFVVIDIDTHPGKANGFDSLQAEGIELPDLPGEWTPNGRHLFGRLPEGVTLRGRGWLPGVEIKAMGNFVAVWPSARSYVSTDPKDNGDLIPVQYRRDPGWPCELRDLPVLPEWLLTDIQTRPAVRQTRDGKRVQEDTSLDRLPPTDKFLESGFGWFTGSRTMDCYRLSWRLWNKFRDEDTVFATIVTIYDLTPDVEGFPWKKVFQTVRAVERQWNEKKLADTQLSNGWSARE
ncbi:bifunctional DNA primase/polymerase [Micromonospora aurantiaca]|uniref:bifunctional DNA primase/polymerase n=1 Tax=Micromonospora aurantiaca (nom. illeg.) TaxID=47850 RepID=UPI0033D3AC9F